MKSYTAPVTPPNQTLKKFLHSFTYNELLHFLLHPFSGQQREANIWKGYSMKTTIRLLRIPPETVNSQKKKH